MQNDFLFLPPIRNQRIELGSSLSLPARQFPGTLFFFFFFPASFLVGRQARSPFSPSSPSLALLPPGLFSAKSEINVGGWAHRSAASSRPRVTSVNQHCPSIHLSVNGSRDSMLPPGKAPLGGRRRVWALGARTGPPHGVPEKAACVLGDWTGTRGGEGRAPAVIAPGRPPPPARQGSSHQAQEPRDML